MRAAALALALIGCTASLPRTEGAAWRASAPGAAEQDWNGDGAWDTRTSGGAVEPRIDEQDFDGDGTADWRLTVWGDALGPTRQEVDEGADGSIDQVIVGTYTETGAAATWEVDRGADGTWDYGVYYYYDTEGHRIAGELDADGDGLADVQQTYDPPCAPPYAECRLDPAC